MEAFQHHRVDKESVMSSKHLSICECLHEGWNLKLRRATVKSRSLSRTINSSHWLGRVQEVQTTHAVTWRSDLWGPCETASPHEPQKFLSSTMLIQWIARTGGGQCALKGKRSERWWLRGINKKEIWAGYKTPTGGVLS